MIFWNAKGYGWSIGKTAWLETGRHFHKSGLDSDEPMVDINEEDIVSGTGINNSKQSLLLWCFPLLYLAQYIV